MPVDGTAAVTAGSGDAAGAVVVASAATTTGFVTVLTGWAALAAAAAAAAEPRAGGRAAFGVGEGRFETALLFSGGVVLPAGLRPCLLALSRFWWFGCGMAGTTTFESPTCSTKASNPASWDSKCREWQSKRSRILIRCSTFPRLQ